MLISIPQWDHWYYQSLPWDLRAQAQLSPLASAAIFHPVYIFAVHWHAFAASWEHALASVLYLAGLCLKYHCQLSFSK